MTSHVELLKSVLEWARERTEPSTGLDLRGALQVLAGDDGAKPWFEAFLLLRDIEPKRYGLSWFDDSRTFKEPVEVVAFVETALRMDEEKRARRLEFLKEQDEKACGGFPF